MPKGRSTFNKRQKEQARQQKQRDKALRRTERKETKPDSPADDMNDLHQHAAEQAALFRVGQDESQAADSTNDSADQENH